MLGPRRPSPLMSLYYVFFAKMEFKKLIMFLTKYLYTPDILNKKQLCKEKKVYAKWLNTVQMRFPSIQYPKLNLHHILKDSFNLIQYWSILIIKKITS